MSAVQYLPIDMIFRREDCRPLDEGIVQSLVESIAAVGLMNPIAVRPKGNRYELIAGSHRLAAHERMGEKEIFCRHADDHDDLHAELAMIDENLCRAELLPSDRARQTARRKAIYEELHPETKAGTAGARASNAAQCNATDNLSTASYAKATADATGRDERSVRRDAERGEKVLPEVHNQLRGTKLDTGVYLDKLKNLPGDEQRAVVARDLSSDRPAAPRAKPAKRSGAPTEASAAEIEDVFARFVALADEMATLPIGEIIASAGKQRSVLGQRASSLADMMSNIMEGLSNA